MQYMHNLFYESWKFFLYLSNDLNCLTIALLWPTGHIRQSYTYVDY